MGHYFGVIRSQDGWAWDRAGCGRHGRPAPVWVFRRQAELGLTRLPSSLASTGCRVRRRQRGASHPGA